MPKTLQDLIKITRNVTGRVDSSDPLFTDTIMGQYINDFIVQLSTQDIRISKNYTWYEFTIDETVATLDPYPVDLQGLQLSTIGPPAYISYTDGTYSNSFPLNWYQSPGNFYAIWPDISTEYTRQRPTDVLYYNNELVFRGPPDQTYSIKISAYQEEIEFTNDATTSQDFMFRYLAYGAALDIFSDYGELDRWNEIFPVFKRYRALVYSRTYSQYQNQRPSPEF